MKTAVIAGTLVDTRMGTELLEGHGLKAEGYPAGRTPTEQSLFQIGPAEERCAAVGRLIEEGKRSGCSRVLIYCNSLSATLDVPSLSKEHSIPVVTPMDVYGSYARKYSRLGVLTANSQGASGIEKAMLAASPGTIVFTAANLALTQGIEDGIPPEKLLETRGIGPLLTYFQTNGAEAVVLGCTHFPYIKEALRKVSELPVLDPGETLPELVRRA